MHSLIHGAFLLDLFLTGFALCFIWLVVPTEGFKMFLSEKNTRIYAELSAKKEQLKWKAAEAAVKTSLPPLHIPLTTI